MSVSKDKERNTWKVYLRFKDWKGTPQVKTKRGFKTKREAQAWEREFLQMQSKDMNMPFSTFVKIYMRDIQPKVRESTYLNKQHIIEKKLLPYFSQKAINEIKASDIIQWQNELLTFRDEGGEPYSPTYLRTIQNQLSAIFNHAVRFYGLQANPSTQAGKMGKANADEMLFWTLDEYQRFIETMKSKPVSYYAFQILYWTGIRKGELLSLTPADFDFVNRKMRINKTYHRRNGEDIMGEPKTQQSNRTVILPDFLAEEIEDYIGSLYGIKPHMRIFDVSKSYLNHEIERGCQESGVKRIRIHDLRHSHVSHAIHLGFDVVAIGERLGHKGETITYTYAHLYPTKQIELADRLSQDRNKMLDRQEMSGSNE